MPNPNPKTHTITSRSDGKFRVSDDTRKTKQASVDKNWNNLTTKDKLDLLAAVIGLIDADGNIVLQ